MARFYLKTIKLADIPGFKDSELPEHMRDKHIPGDFYHSKKSRSKLMGHILKSMVHIMKSDEPIEKMYHFIEEIVRHAEKSAMHWVKKGYEV
jgi:hypothetical protein